MCIASLGTAQSRTLGVLAQHKVTRVVHLTDQDWAGISAGFKLASALADSGVNAQVVVDLDRQATITSRVAGLDASLRTILLEAGQAPPAQLAEWRAVHEVDLVRRLNDMGWVRGVHWKDLAKDAGDLLGFKMRGRQMIEQALA